MNTRTIAAFILGAVIGISLAFLVIPRSAGAGSPGWNRSLWVCSAVYSDGMPTYDHCDKTSNEAKEEEIETSLYDFEGGDDGGEASDDGDDDSSDE